MLSILTHLKPLFPFRQSEAEYKDLPEPEELRQSRPSEQQEGPVQVVSDQSKQDKAAEEVSVPES